MDILPIVVFAELEASLWILKRKRKLIEFWEL